MKVLPLLTAGMWPLALLVGAVALVTIIALFRANRDQVPAVFESFARAFGIHRRGCAHDDPPESEENRQSPLDNADQDTASANDETQMREEDA